MFFNSNFACVFILMGMI
jgi:pre-mRNA-processing factor 40